MNAPELIHHVEAVGGTLSIKGNRIRYDLPREAETLVPELRRLREEVIVVLKQRILVPPLPNGVSVVEWSPKQAPVALTSCSVVMDVPAFIDATLRELQAKLAEKNWLAGNRGLREILERLEQVGVRLRIEMTKH